MCSTAALTDIAARRQQVRRERVILYLLEEHILADPLLVVELEILSSDMDVTRLSVSFPVTHMPHPQNNLPAQTETRN